MKNANPFFYTTLLLLYLVPSGLVYAQGACQSSVPPKCEIYKECMEVTCNCATSDYPYTASFGPKYCDRFKKNEQFSAEGKKWRDKTLACLADQASQAFVKNSSAEGGCNCQALQLQMIDSHTECYTSPPSFCGLSDSDLRVAARIVDIPDFVSLGSRGVLEIGKTLITCVDQKGKEKALHMIKVYTKETVVEGGEIAVGYTREVLDSIAAQADQRGWPEFATKVREWRDALVPSARNVLP